MTSRDFCYWLQGLFELGGPKALDEKQTDLVKRHLAMVFVHEIDPSIDKASPDTKKLLDKLHEEGAKPPPAIPTHGPGCPGTPVFRC